MSIQSNKFDGVCVSVLACPYMASAAACWNAIMLIYRSREFKYVDLKGNLIKAMMVLIRLNMLEIGAVASVAVRTLFFLLFFFFFLKNEQTIVTCIC